MECACDANPLALCDLSDATGNAMMYQMQVTVWYKDKVAGLYQKPVQSLAKAVDRCEVCLCIYLFAH